jgi:hypothetical protein
MIRPIDGAVALVGFALCVGCGDKSFSMAPDAVHGDDDASEESPSDATPDAGSGMDAATVGASADASTGSDGPGDLPPEGIPETVLLDGAELERVRTAFQEGQANPEQEAALANLLKAADLALAAGTWSVTTKDDSFVVNGDPHLYTSWGPYWWPADAEPPDNPGTPGRCPYANHDGLRNPEVTSITDRHGLHASSEAIFQLALAWYFTGKPAYADQAALVARSWYLDPATALKPDMSYAQRPGPCGGGSPYGLIEASGGYLTDALDGLAILALDTRPDGWNANDRDGMRQWLSDFLAFLDDSAIGRGENDTGNNHGTWFDTMVSSIALFLGDRERAGQIVEAAKARRIDPQIQGDGAQPEELARTTSWHYSNYNAAALCRLAGIAAHVGVDLWSYHSGDGGSIVKAIEFLIPTAISGDGAGPWARYDDIEVPFDAVYKAEAYYTIRAAAVYGHSAAAAAVFAASPVAVQVPGRFCDGSRFPTGSTFCGVTSGEVAFLELQEPSESPVDMWPIIPTCRVPIH